MVSRLQRKRDKRDKRRQPDPSGPTNVGSFERQLKKEYRQLDNPVAPTIMKWKGAIASTGSGGVQASPNRIPKWVPQPIRPATLPVRHGASWNTKPLAAKPVRGGSLPPKSRFFTAQESIEQSRANRRAGAQIRTNLGISPKNAQQSVLRSSLPAPPKNKPDALKQAENYSPHVPATRTLHSELPAVDHSTCKARPKSNKSKGGGSRNFVPWCDRK